MWPKASTVVRTMVWICSSSPRSTAMARAFPALAAMVSATRFAPFEVDVRNCDFRALFRQQACGRRPDSACTSRDQCDLAG